MSPSTIAVVPLRSPGVGKTRLAPMLSPTFRSSLASAMLIDVVSVLRRTSVSDIVIAASGEAATALAAELGVRAVPDPPGATGLNEVLAAAVAGFAHSPDVLIVAADLPRLAAADVEAVLRCDAQVVCAPTNGNGTAALLRRPASRIATAYGVDSARRHHEFAVRAGASFQRLEREGFRHDVDTIDDVTALLSTTTGPATARVIAGLALPI